MTHEEKIHYMEIATRLVGYNLPLESLDLMISLYELVLEKGSEADLKTICAVEAAVKQRSDLKHKQDMLDKVSTKV